MSSVLREQLVTVRVGRWREIWRGGQGYRGFLWKAACEFQKAHKKGFG